MKDASQLDISQQASMAIQGMEGDGAVAKVDWTQMSSDERAAMQMLGSSSSISPEKVTNEVLKICNVVRQKLDVHGEGEKFMRKRSGLGGTGGRRLSPEMRIHFGTFGFKNGEALRGSAMTSPHTIATSPMNSRGHTSF